MKNLFFITCLVLLSCNMVQAQQQTKKERIRYLFTLMGQDSMMAKMATTMSSYWSKSMKDADNEYGTSTYDSARNSKSMHEAMENVREMMQSVMVESYDRHFTGVEIEDFIAFYHSASGQKMVKEMPMITNEMFMSMAAKNQAFIKKEMEGQQ